jgi:integrase
LQHEVEPWGLYFFFAVLAGARKSNVLGARWDAIDLQRGNWTVEAEEAKGGKKLIISLATELIDALSIWRTKQAGTSPWVFPAEDKRHHLVEPKRPWKRVLLRAEAFRLVGVIAELKGWTSAEEQAQQEKVLEECGSLRLRAMGRQEKLNDDPMRIVVAALRLRVKEAGADPDERGMLDLRIHDLRRTLGSWCAMNGASLTVIGKALGHRSMASTEVYSRLTMDPVRNAVEGAATKMLAFR